MIDQTKLCNCAKTSTLSPSWGMYTSQKNKENRSSWKMKRKI